MTIVLFHFSDVFLEDEVMECTACAGGSVMLYCPLGIPNSIWVKDETKMCVGPRCWLHNVRPSYEGVYEYHKIVNNKAVGSFYTSLHGKWT